MAADLERGPRLTVSVPPRLHADLQRIATEELTSIAAVARRLIKAGVAHELRPTSETPEGETA